MPELETRFAQIPDWLNYNQPPVPSFLQTRQDNREQMRSGREERALQMREELQPLMVKDQELQNATAKAALDYTMQTREAETKAALLVPQIEKLEGGWGSIEAITLWQNEVLKNPAIANSKVGELIGRNIGTALQYGKTLEDAKRRLEFEQRRNAITEETYRLNAEQAQSRAMGGKPEDIARASFVQQMTTLRSELVTARSIPDATERAREMARIRRDVSDLTRKYNRVIGIEDMALEEPAMPEEPKTPTKAEELLKTMQENLDVAKMNGETYGHFDANGAFNPDLRISPWSKPISDLQKEIDDKRKSLGGAAAAESKSTPSGGVILKRSDIFKK